MLEHWARAAFYTQRLAEILKMERKAFENMRDAWEAMGNGGSGRPTRGPRQSYRPEDDNAALVRAETDKLMVENPRKWSNRHHASFTTQLAFREDLLKAIAESPNHQKYLLHQYKWRQRNHFGKHYTDGTNYKISRMSLVSGEIEDIVTDLGSPMGLTLIEA